MTSSDHASIAPGYVLSGKYRVEEVIGEGGMGIVLKAHHLALDEPVAIKLLCHGGPPSREALGRFTREARAAVKIKSEHVVRTFDVAELDDGTPYMVMELLAGTDLQARLEATGPLGVHDVVPLGSCPLACVRKRRFIRLRLPTRRPRAAHRVPRATDPGRGVRRPTGRTVP